MASGSNTGASSFVHTIRLTPIPVEVQVALAGIAETYQEVYVQIAEALFKFQTGKACRIEIAVDKVTWTADVPATHSHRKFRKRIAFFQLKLVAPGVADFGILRQLLKLPPVDETFLRQLSNAKQRVKVAANKVEGQLTTGAARLPAATATHVGIGPHATPADAMHEGGTAVQGGTATASPAAEGDAANNADAAAGRDAAASAGPATNVDAAGGGDAAADGEAADRQEAATGVGPATNADAAAARGTAAGGGAAAAVVANKVASPAAGAGPSNKRCSTRLAHVRSSISLFIVILACIHVPESYNALLMPCLCVNAAAHNHISPRWHT